jgi:hypothetical protein
VGTPNSVLSLGYLLFEIEDQFFKQYQVLNDDQNLTFEEKKEIRNNVLFRAIYSYFEILG